MQRFRVMWDKIYILVTCVYFLYLCCRLFFATFYRLDALRGRLAHYHTSRFPNNPGIWIHSAKIPTFCFTVHQIYICAIPAASCRDIVNCQLRRVQTIHINLYSFYCHLNSHGMKMVTFMDWRHFIYWARWLNEDQFSTATVKGDLLRDGYWEFREFLVWLKNLEYCLKSQCAMTTIWI